MTAATRLRVLALGPTSLDSMHHGVGLRASHLIRRLRRHHDVHYIHFQEGNERAADAESTVVQPEAPAPLTAARRVGRWFRIGFPCEFSDAMDRAVSMKLAGERFDAMLTFSYALLQYAHGKGLPVVADMVDEPVLTATRERELASNWTQRRKCDKHLLEVRHYERSFRQDVHTWITVWQEGADSLRRTLPDARVAVVPNGVDTDYFRPGGGTGEPYTILFSGNMGFAPNLQAVEYFATQIFPLLRQRCPQARWNIVGAYGPDSLQALSSQHIRVTGFVPDIRPWIERAAVVVSPLISGGGIKNKVLEAWAMRKAVVATPLGCSGLVAQDGKNILVASDPLEFAQKTADVLADPSLADAISEGGYQTVRVTYSWERSAEILADILQEAASRV